jgi:hypothetical protein
MNVAADKEPLTGVFGPGTPRSIKVATVGSSTTVTAVTASSAPFAGLAVGDLLIFRAVSPDAAKSTSGTREVVISTFTSSDQVVVSSAIDLSNPTGGYTFSFKKRVSATQVDRMFFDVSKFSSFAFQADVEGINATSLDFIVECRARKFGVSYTEAAWTKNFTATGSARVDITTPWEQCRVGWKINTDTGVQDVATHFVGIVRQ